MTALRTTFHLANLRQAENNTILRMGVEGVKCLGTIKGEMQEGDFQLTDDQIIELAGVDNFMMKIDGAENGTIEVYENEAMNVFLKAHGQVIGYAIIRPEPKLPPCSKCGDPIDPHFHKEFNARLVALQMCHSCDFWNTFKERMDNEPYMHWVINGNGYSIGRSPDIIGQRAFGGHTFYVRPLGDAPKFKTSMLWHRGDIPEAWKNDLPDNAKFVSPSDYFTDKAADEFQNGLDHGAVK
jgi:hypothetical protein